ncbi:hypothetical protein IKF15_04485 [Candidatus Saccharibacteria bacterium]|nr:hypothetical protein [Candidatus Saccharibacteria bacterium]
MEELYLTVQRNGIIVEDNMSVTTPVNGDAALAVLKDGSFVVISDVEGNFSDRQSRAISQKLLDLLYERKFITSTSDKNGFIAEEREDEGTCKLANGKTALVKGRMLHISPPKETDAERTCQFIDKTVGEFLKKEGGSTLSKEDLVVSRLLEDEECDNPEEEGEETNPVDSDAQATAADKTPPKKPARALTDEEKQFSEEWESLYEAFLAEEG